MKLQPDSLALAIIEKDDIDQFNQFYVTRYNNDAIRIAVEPVEWEIICGLAPASSKIGKLLRDWGKGLRTDYNELDYAYQDQKRNIEKNDRFNEKFVTAINQIDLKELLADLNNYGLALIYRNDVAQLKELNQILRGNACTELLQSDYFNVNISSFRFGYETNWIKWMAPLASGTNRLACLEILLADFHTLQHSKLKNGDDFELNRCFYFAAKYGHQEICSYLAGHDQLVVNPTNTDIVWSTPLILAVKNGWNDIIKVLLARGANVNVAVYATTALQMCVSTGNVVMIDDLIAAGATLEEKLQNRAEALLLAASTGGSGKMVNKLVACKEFIYSRYYTNDTPLHKAASRGDAAVVEVLLNHGADINEKNNKLQTALHLACIQGYYDAPLVLIRKGALLDEQDSLGNTALHYLVENNTGLVKELIKAGVTTNIRNIKGETALHYLAAQCGGVGEYIKTLGLQDLYSDQADSKGVTALEYALKRTHLFGELLQGLLASNVRGLPIEFIINKIEYWKQKGSQSTKEKMKDFLESDIYKTWMKIFEIYQLAKQQKYPMLLDRLEALPPTPINFITNESYSLFHLLLPNYEKQTVLLRKIRNVLINKHHADPYIPDHEGKFAYERCTNVSPSVLRDFFYQESHLHLFKLTRDASVLLHKVFQLQQYPNAATEVDYTYVDKNETNKIQLNPEQLVRLLHDEIAWLIETMSNQTTPVPKKLLLQLNQLLPDENQANLMLQVPHTVLSQQETDNLSVYILYLQNIISLHFHETSTSELGKKFPKTEKITAKDRFLRTFYKNLIPETPVSIAANAVFFKPQLEMPQESQTKVYSTHLQETL